MRYTMDLQNDVLRFMQIAGQPLGDPNAPALPPIELSEFDTLVELYQVQAELLVIAERLKKHPGRVPLRCRLMIEELSETVKGYADNDPVAVADGLADLTYVTVGSAVDAGIDLGMVWSAVQAANMAKFPKCPECDGTGIRDGWEPAQCPKCGGKGRVVMKDAQGKVIKPEGWAPADVAAVLRRQERGNTSEVRKPPTGRDRMRTLWSQQHDFLPLGFQEGRLVGCITAVLDATHTCGESCLVIPWGTADHEERFIDPDGDLYLVWQPYEREQEAITEIARTVEGAGLTFQRWAVGEIGNPSWHAPGQTEFIVVSKHGVWEDA